MTMLTMTMELFLAGFNVTTLNIVHISLTIAQCAQDTKIRFGDL